MPDTHRAAVTALLSAFAADVESLVRRLAVETVEAALGPSAVPVAAAPDAAPKRRRRRAGRAPAVTPKAKPVATVPAPAAATATVGPVPPHKRQARAAA